MESGSSAPFEIGSDIHSDDVQEVVVTPPNWILRWGYTILFSILCIVCACSWFIHYPDVVLAPFTLRSKDAPISISTRVDGRIHELLVTDGSFVFGGQDIAYLESTAEHKQVIQLGIIMDSIFNAIESGKWVEINRFNAKTFTSLGELQLDFQIFYSKLIELRSTLQDGIYLKRRRILETEYFDLIQIFKNIEEQRDLQLRDFDLALADFKIQERLYSEKAISLMELNKEKAKLISREIPIKAFSQTLLQNRAVQASKQKEIIELDNAINEKKSNFIQTLLTLKSSVEGWKKKYIITAPITGKVSFSAPLDAQQYLQAMQGIATIEPKLDILQGFVKIPQENMGKLVLGQRVLIKLDGFPYREFGVLHGRLSKLSTVPGADSSYWGLVEIKNDMSKSSGKRLIFRNGMKGTAEIVTFDRRLIERLFSVMPVREL